MQNGLDKTDRFKQYFDESRGEPKLSKITIKEVITPYNEEIDHYMSNDNIDDVDMFIELLRALLEKAWGDDCPVIVDEYPTNQDADNRKLPMILYDYYDRVYSEKTKRAPNVINSNITINGERYEELSEWFDMKVQFDICASSQREAKIISKRFEIFMSTYIPYFKFVGVNNIYFYNQPRGETYQLANHDIPTRILIYKVKLERKYLRKHGEALSTYNIVLELSNELNEVE